MPKISVTERDGAIQYVIAMATSLAAKHPEVRESTLEKAILSLETLGVGLWEVEIAAVGLVNNYGKNDLPE